jgi:hypothetical protein
MNRDEFVMTHDIRDTITYAFASFSAFATVADANEFLTLVAAVIAILVGVTRLYDWVAIKLKNQKNR